MVSNDINSYESRELLEQYMAFHFADAEDYCPWVGAPFGAMAFPQRVAELAIRHSKLSSGLGARALDLGCAVGRTALELTREFDEVVGIDLSENFIRHAQAVASGEITEFEMTEEGERRKVFKIVRCANWRAQRVKFQIGDACRLEPWPGQFDLALMANLLCRSVDPESVLAQAPELVRPGGLLVITTPCSWMEKFTPRKKWLCQKTGHTMDGLKSSLGAYFTLRERQDMPFLIREHARKYQWGIAEVTFWTRIDGVKS